MNDLGAMCLSPACRPPESLRSRTREADRRLAPRLWHTDWLILRDLRRAIEHVSKARAKPGTSAIDFGCGSMPYAPLFEDRGVHYAGADLDGADIAILADGRMDAQTGSADMLLSFQVLEHVRDLDVYFEEAKRVLRPDGTMILSTHGNWLYHPHPEDHRRWTRQGLCSEIEAQGFEVLECFSLVGPLAWTTMMRLTCFATPLRRIPLVGGLAAGALALVMNLRAMLEDKVTPGWVSADNACVYLTVSRPR